MSGTKLLMSSMIAACVLMGVSANATDSKYRKKLEQSGCTQVSEMQGCDINKTKAQNAKSGFGLAFCGGGGIKRRIEYTIIEKAPDQWDASVTVNGETQKAMTSYSFFGKSKPPQGFVVAIIPEKQGGGEFLVFSNGGKRWIEFGDYQYDQCK
ncbi:MAG: hypothetical protein ACOVPA_12440 [Rubrivivax sp.]|jgi:hypothetical protein